MTGVTYPIDELLAVLILLEEAFGRELGGSYQALAKALLPLVWDAPVVLKMDCSSSKQDDRAPGTPDCPIHRGWSLEIPCFPRRPLLPLPLQSAQSAAGIYGSILNQHDFMLHLVLHVHVQRKIVDCAIGGEGLFVGEDGHRLVEVVLGKSEGSLDLGDVGEAHAEQGVDVLVVALHLEPTPPPPL